MPKQDYVFESAPFVSVLFGPRGGVVGVFTGKTEEEASAKARSPWAALQAKFSGKDTGAAPIYEVYKLVRTSPNNG